ncbi:glycosyl transferase [Prochlorococcus sp. MIT 1307]|uniref:glycosyl transferase n=1 Tax=Prochlorococcus sp. MIT 1307 TaxID=3096219 RepID=UPI002A75A0E1|nr:glycosyl transferase [Prochlorococcus sp. MIT 1307]
MKEASLVVVFISNGPGELATWVKPLAEKLHTKLLMQPKAKYSPVSLRLVLVPCPNATGNETKAARKWGDFEQITPPTNFWKLLLCPQKYGIWPNKGLVVFLGGDQFWSVLLSARLGYRHLTYAEWVARWPQWNDKIAAMSTKVMKRLPKRYRSRCTVVGDLMADLNNHAKEEQPLSKGTWVALMPGSKKAKLSVGVPFFLEVADILSTIIPECNFLLPIAPTTNIIEIQKFVSSNNPIASQYNTSIKTIAPQDKSNNLRKLITKQGTEIYLHEDPPAHNPLSQCHLALTTVGANTAELGALAVPMIVIVPTQHLYVMQAWDGVLGLIGRIPGLRRCIGLLISIWRMRKKGFLAWPNISAGRTIVPERVGIITPKEIATEAAQWLQSPERLKGQKEDLQNLRGKPGAVEAMSQEVIKLLPKSLIKL